MPGLYIASTQPRAGKTLCACSLGVILQKRGYRVGYMKPMGYEHKQVEAGRGDAGALVVQELLGQEAMPEKLTPLLRPSGWPDLGAWFSPLSSGSSFGQPGPANPAGPSAQLNDIRQAYAEISRGNDLTLVSGSGIFPAWGQFAGLDGLTLVNELDLRVLLVESCEDGFDFDSVLFMRKLLGERLCGVILNKIAPADLPLYQKLAATFLESRGVRVLGLIPQEPELNVIRCMQLSYELNGRIVAGNNSASALGIKDFIIGSMQVESFMAYMRSRSACAVITGGDRADLQLAAMCGKENCLVLTGNIGPGELVRSRAEQADVPVIVVREDTYTVARRIARILKGRKFNDLRQMDFGLRLLQNNADVDGLLACLGL
ncbi:MAG: AAA family ATPase [Deltaproteobacteria bacterium]|jgi:BioD-like phosphotransacetylase family protein|nr:AAA family ATPase [Deltaproteobacteria bacterium]